MQKSVDCTPPSPISGPFTSEELANALNHLKEPVKSTGLDSIFPEFYSTPDHQISSQILVMRFFQLPAFANSNFSGSGEEH